ncbi:dispanin subfamily A member 2b-like [Podarcis lilfordi]|uniref:Dispanin subfamily A member 2b-like n=1 Tax=Podarcis lilfordi TaxID=74358 RepID=A0AA35JQD6_9SAUR|nr:dispanin subfamily A member 2b-like [Podarcis lilfordi]
MQSASHQPVAINMQFHTGYEPSAPPCASRAGGVAAPPPQDHVLWSLFSFSFLNACCLGFAALVYSIKSRDNKVLGYSEIAATYGRTSKCLNIAALILSIIFFIVFIIIIVHYSA